MNQTMLITQKGLTQLQAELDELNNIRRPQLVERLALARSMGDLSENSDYQSAKEDLAFVDGRIAELEDLLKSAQVVSPINDGKVGLGHSVTVQINGTKAVFMIVGEWEADPSKKQISHASPLGQALMGKTVGEKVEVPAPAGKVVYTIASIE
jgi:transcription elongation factor GreA